MRTKQICLSLLLACASLLAVPAVRAQGASYQPVIHPNFSYPAQSFTATAQTGATIGIGGAASGTIAVTGTLTTVTWAVQGSNDNGAHFFPLLTAAITVPATTATTETTTAPTLYAVNLAGITNVRFVTSGTFTAATAVAFKLTASQSKGVL